MPDADSILGDSQYDLFKGLLLQSQFKVCIFSPFLFNGTHHLNHRFPPLSALSRSSSFAISLILFSFSETRQHLHSEFALLCSQLLQFKRMSRAGWLGCLFNIACFTWYPQHSDINKHHTGFDQARL